MEGPIRPFFFPSDRSLNKYKFSKKSVVFEVSVLQNTTTIKGQAVNEASSCSAV